MIVALTLVARRPQILLLRDQMEKLSDMLAMTNRLMERTLELRQILNFAYFVLKSVFKHCSHLAQRYCGGITARSHRRWRRQRQVSRDVDTVFQAGC